jgi:hypothetical protein
MSNFYLASTVVDVQLLSSLDCGQLLYLCSWPCHSWSIVQKVMLLAVSGLIPIDDIIIISDTRALEMEHLGYVSTFYRAR